MSEISASIIYAPSLYWFAYRYCEGLVVAKGDKPQPLASIDWVEDRYCDILVAFDVPPTFKLRSDRPSRHYDLLQTEEPATNRQYEYFTTPDEQLEGFLYPQRLHDTYALNFNIFRPENPGNDSYRVGDLAKFNPKNCFQPPSEPPLGYLGQTLLLSAYLAEPRPKNPRKLDDLARQCWLDFFQVETPETFPSLYRVRPLFGGYLYEYGNPKADVTENPYGHLLVWLLFDDAPTVLMEKCYWELPELLLYYHKISQSFRDSRTFYNNADRIVTENEIDLNQLKAKYLDRETGGTLSVADLRTLQSTLKTLMKTALTYSQQLRNLEYARNTIAINTKNYQTTLDRAEQLAQHPLEALRVFHHKEAIAFQDQISADLNYFKQGTALLDTAINSIRGLVDIDRADRDRNLQNTIAIVGVGLGFAAVGSTISPFLINEERDRELVSEYWQPFGAALLLSLVFAGVGIVVGGILAKLIQKWHDKRDRD